ncbi:MAG: family 20 glycosylhydrolase [bacterium]|nr:family 20 glycosylhydrolase [bacterium]
MKDKFFSRGRAVIPIRGIHFDLKGLPPAPSRLLEFLDLLCQARINCVLVEWEDTYPWQKYPELRNQTAYSMSTVKKFLKKAECLGIEVIPLVQSFGHLENVLSKKRFKKFREIPDNVSDICPLADGARQIVMDMVEDVLLTHTGIRYFHLGGDEVWTLGSCEKCKSFIEKNGKSALYLYHLEPIFEFLHARNIRPIIWDDMMRKWNISELKRIAKHTDLMCWSYAKDPFIYVSKQTMDKFLKAGCKIWAASAFKGGDGPYVDIPDKNVRLANMLEWVKYAGKMKMEGVIATGWSRYNTFCSPCESIETSLDTLALSGKIAWDGKLPVDPSEWAKDFLEYSQKKGIRTSHFHNCRAVSEQLQNWRDSVFAQARTYLQQAHLAGEPDRINPFRAKEEKNALIEAFRKVKQYARDWEKVHKGFVPAIWIKKYTLSRIEPVKKIVNLILKNTLF